MRLYYTPGKKNVTMGTVLTVIFQQCKTPAGAGAWLFSILCSIASDLYHSMPELDECSHVLECSAELAYIAHLVVVPSNYSYLEDVCSALLCECLCCVEE